MPIMKMESQIRWQRFPSGVWRCDAEYKLDFFTDNVWLVNHLPNPLNLLRGLYTPIRETTTIELNPTGALIAGVFLLWYT